LSPKKFVTWPWNPWNSGYQVPLDPLVFTAK
jgi:hypothetical protein